LIKHFVISYDKNGDGDISNDERVVLNSMDEYKAKIKELISSKTNFIGDASDNRLDANGDIERETSFDEGTFKKSGDAEVNDVMHKGALFQGEKIVYVDGTELPRNMQTNDDFELAEFLANKNLNDKDFQSMPAAEKVKALEEDGYEAKQIKQFFRKHPELVSKGGGIDGMMHTTSGYEKTVKN